MLDVRAAAVLAGAGLLAPTRPGSATGTVLTRELRAARPEQGA